MPLVDLNSPTALLLEWGWFLVTRANGIVYLLIVAVFLLGIFVRLPRAKRDIAAVEEQASTIAASSDPEIGP